MDTAGKPRDHGTEAADAPRSRAREIAARGYAPTARNYGKLLHAAINDVLLGGLQKGEVAAVCGGVRAVVAVARNRDAIDELHEKQEAPPPGERQELADKLHRIADEIVQ